MALAVIKQYCILHKALLDRKPPSSNQAMLDKRDTAAKLAQKLADAFLEWQLARPPGETRTKADLARRCEEISGQRCTPQAVNSWFKTGRMDKTWLPVVERVLGTSLGFGHGEQLELENMGHTKKPDPRLAWPFIAVTLDEVLALSDLQRMRLESTMRSRIDELVEDAGNHRGRASRAAKA
jgi:hypothetical protein